MKSEKTLITKDSIREKTYSNIERINDLIKRVSRYNLDVDKEAREKAGTCKYCCYIQGPQMAMQAFWTKPCGICSTEMTFSSSHTDVLCPVCAKDNSLCRHCGADLNLSMVLKPKRKNLP